MSQFEERKKLYCLDESLSIEDALAVIEENNHRCVIILGEGDRVVGTLSDGDARKSILAHTVLSTPVNQVMNLNFKHVVLESGVDKVAKASEVLKKHSHISILPIVDKTMKLVDIYIREDLEAK